MTDDEFKTQFEQLKDQLTTCYAMILEIRDMVTDNNTLIHKADEAITTISDQVNPLIDDIRTGGVMKLLSGGLGKRK